MKVLLVDDDSLVTSGIEIILKAKSQSQETSVSIVAIGSNGEEAIQLYDQFKPDIVLMDIRMPVLSGIEAGKAIMEQDPDARIIYLTTFLEDEYIIDALKYGAKGYLLKTDFESLVPAMNAVMRGQRVFGDEIVAKIPGYLEQDKIEKRADPLIAELSEKDHELIYWVAQGLNNKEIAEKMHFSEGTIRNYLSEILDKLSIRDRTQLAIYYFKNIEGMR